MPVDKYNFRPVDSVRSFADHMLHFAKSNAGMEHQYSIVFSPFYVILKRPCYA